MCAACKEVVAILWVKDFVAYAIGFDLFDPPTFDWPICRPKTASLCCWCSFVCNFAIVSIQDALTTTKISFCAFLVAPDATASAHEFMWEELPNSGGEAPLTQSGSNVDVVISRRMLTILAGV